MIIEDIKNIKSGKKDLLKFGLTMGIVLGLLGGFTWWRGKEYCYYFLIISAIFFFFTFTFSSILKPVNKLWMTIAILMSWFMTRLILCMLFYLGITPMSLFARLIGKNFLGPKINRNTTKSYWIPKEKNKIDYEKQF